MAVDTVLFNAKVYTKGEILDAGIAVDEGKIVKVAKEPNLPSASNKVNLHGCLALPGLIDVHVHLRDQHQADEEDFFTGTAAAVAGGITTVLDMPNNKPVTSDSAALRDRMRMARGRIMSNVGFCSAFPESVDEIRRVVKEGAIAFKLFLNTQIGGLNIDDDGALLRAFSEVEKLGIPVAVHAEDKETIEAAACIERRHGRNGVEAYLKAHAPQAEIKAVERILRIIHKTDVQIHFCHLSTTETIVLVDNAKKEGLKVSCEVTPHHLLSTSQDYRRHGTIFLTDPPLRSIDIVEELWKAVKKTQIDVVASDHAPHFKVEKTADSIWNVKPGIPGLETTLPLLLTKVNEGRLTLEEIVRLMAEKPAEIFNLHRSGMLKRNYDANITIVDMHRRGVIDSSSFFSKAKYSPFDKWEVKGLPVKTFVNGLLVMDDGQVVIEADAGKILLNRASTTE